MVRALAVPRIMHKYDLVLAPGAGRLLRHFYLYALALSNRDASSGPLRSRLGPRSAACLRTRDTGANDTNPYRSTPAPTLEFVRERHASQDTWGTGVLSSSSRSQTSTCCQGERQLRYLLTYLVLPGVSCINRASSASTRLVASLTPSPRVRAASRTARSSRNVAADVLNSDDRSAIR